MDFLPRPSNPCVIWLLPLSTATCSQGAPSPTRLLCPEARRSVPKALHPCPLGFYLAPPVSAAQMQHQLLIHPLARPFPPQRLPQSVFFLSWDVSSRRGEALCCLLRVLAHILVLDRCFLMDRLGKSCGFRLHRSRVPGYKVCTLYA